MTKGGRGTTEVNGLDIGRLERSLALTVSRIEHGRYLVTGGETPHVVERRARPGEAPRLRCDCLDALWRPGVRCKHVLAVMTTRGDHLILGALGVLVGEARRQRRRAASPDPRRGARGKR